MDSFAIVRNDEMCWDSGLALAAAAASSTLNTESPLHPSDNQMIRGFKKHKQQLAEVLQMFQADAGLERVGDLAGGLAGGSHDSGR